MILEYRNEAARRLPTGFCFHMATAAALMVASMNTWTSGDDQADQQIAPMAAPEPDSSVRKVIEQPGVAILSNREGRIVSVAVGAPASDELLKQLASLPGLKKLDIGTTRQLTVKGFEHLAAAPALESLVLSDIALPPLSLEQVARFAKLRELSINDCGLRDADLGPLEACTELRLLSLYGNAITDAGLHSIVKLTKLEELSLSNSSSVGSVMRITDEGLARLTALKQLKQLNLSSTRLPLGFSDKGLVHLAAFPDLNSLHLAGEGLSDEALVHIGRCTKLERLGLNWGSFTDAGMAEIRKLTKLKWIRISSHRLTEAGLLQLGGLSRLEFVELRTDAATDRVLESLSRIKSLARLDLYANSRSGVFVSAPPFTAAGLAHFKDHPGLRTLWLKNATIDTGLLTTLKTLGQLDELTLMMPGLTDVEVRGLQAALPTTRVSAAWSGHGIAPLQRSGDLKRRGAGDMRRNLGPARRV